MNYKEISEIRRHIRRDRSNMTAIYGCYVNANKEIISEFRQSTGMMSENDGEKYFALLRKSVSGTLGKNLIDINFTTGQVADSPEHKLLMQLRSTALGDEEIRRAFYKKIIESLTLDDNYLILIGFDSYDVPFRTKDGETDKDRGEETFNYIICSICPVKQEKGTLNYEPENREFHDGGITNVVSTPEVGFLFPAFDHRSTNIYNALYYTRSAKESHTALVDNLFHTRIPQPAAEQKKSFDALLGNVLQDACSLDVVQTVHEQISQKIELHKESRIPDPVMMGKEDVQQALETCGVEESKIVKFGFDYDEVFGLDAELHPKNIINTNRFEITTPDVSIKIAPEKADLIEMRNIGGINYILIPAEDAVEVNGVNIHIQQEEPAAP